MAKLIFRFRKGVIDLSSFSNLHFCFISWTFLSDVITNIIAGSVISLHFHGMFANKLQITLIIIYVAMYVCIWEWIANFKNQFLCSFVLLFISKNMI